MDNLSIIIYKVVKFIYTTNYYLHSHKFPVNIYIYVYVRIYLYIRIYDKFHDLHKLFEFLIAYMHNNCQLVLDFTPGVTYIPTSTNVSRY